MTLSRPIDRGRGAGETGGPARVARKRKAPTGFVTPPLDAYAGANVVPLRAPRARRGKLERHHVAAFRLRNELAWLVKHRNAFGGPSISDTAWCVVLADLQVFLFGPVDFDTVDALRRNLGVWPLDAEAMTRAVRDASSASQALGAGFNLPSPDKVGALLRVSTDERDTLLLRAIGAEDETAAARRRRLRRERAAERRAAAGHTPRDQALTRLRPWEEIGISRRTWERRRRACSAG